MGRRQCTLQDIADEAGCSKNTVSLALRDSSRISEATRENIRKLAHDLGYITNIAARNLTTRRSGLIGVYTHAVQDDVRSTLINRLLTGLHTAEYKPLLGLGYGHEGNWHTSPWMQTFQEMNIEALVLAFTTFGRMPTWLRDIPVVLVGCYPTKRPPCDSVALDRHEVGEMGVRHLIQQGHEHICVATGTDSGIGKGCMETLKCANLPPAGPCPQTSPPPTELAAFCDSVLASQPQPTAIFFGDTPLAVNFMRVALQKGISIPKDLAIIGYDYFSWADMLKIPLTTIEQPLDAMANAALDMVGQRLKNPAAPRMRQVLPHRLVIRAST
jgi:LacI family transcriptional regulator, galactose operon repressor